MPEIIKYTDWKTEYIKYPFFSPKYFRTKYGINKYDIDNFNKAIGKNKYYKEKIHDLKLSLNLSPDKIINIFEIAWKLYYNRILKIDIKNFKENDTEKIIHLKNISKKNEYQFLTSGKYLKKICSEQYNFMKNKGYTNIYISQFLTYPGKHFFLYFNIMPIMFHQTHIKNVPTEEILRLIKYIIFNKHDQLKLLEKDDKYLHYLIRYKEQTYITRNFLIKNGCVEHLYNKIGTLKNIKDKIAKEIENELNVHNNNKNENWSSQKFYQKNEIEKYKYCKYCTSKSFDLHHLLSRKEYSDYMYISNNVIPLCGNVHNIISRNKDIHNHIKYDNLCNLFIENELKDNSIFDNYLKELHKLNTC